MACLVLLASCGSGTFGILAASDSSSSSGNAATVGSELAVTDGGSRRPWRSPATVSFLLTDEEGDAADCQVLVDGRPITLEPGSSLTQVPSGTTHTVLWNFLADLGDERRHSGLTLTLSVEGGISPDPLTDVEVGNDAPVIEEVTSPAAEVAGIVPIVFRVSDSSADRADVLVEYDVADDGVEDWQPATVSGTPLVGLETSAAGLAYTFVWNTGLDLQGREVDVQLRFRGRDRPFGSLGDPFVTPGFTVDNNAEPLALLDAGQLLANPDRRRGIPLPFEIVDAEGDETRVVVQWRRPGEAFVDLPEDPGEILAILADPELRRDYQVANEYPKPVGGLAVPLTSGGSSAVRLPELGSDAALLLADGIVDRELELLRPSRRPEPVASTWTANPLRGPVTALPLEDPRVLVLDHGGGGARVSSVDLATGELVMLAQIAGTPCAMAREPGESSAIVATEVGGSWSVSRVALDGTVTPLVDAADGTTEHGRVRGLAVLGRYEALVTVGSSLVHLRYPIGGTPSANALCEGLSTPWGIALDPHLPNRVYLAERDAPTPDGIGRVVVFELDRRASELVRASGTGPFVHAEDGTRSLRASFVRPTSIAFEPGTARLLAVTDTLRGEAGCELQGVELGSPQGNAVFEIARLPAAAASLATGPGGLRLVSLPGLDDLAVGGGVQQRRTITGFDPARDVVEVDRAFEPALEPLTPWRVFRTAEVVSSSTAGTRHDFLWDSRDLEGGGQALFRLTPFDSEAGRASESPSSKEVLSPFVQAEDALILGGPGMTDEPRSGLAVDLDADGDLDLVSANAESHTLALFFQDAGGFQRPPTSLQVGTVPGVYPVAVAAGDLDQDGDLDLVSANGRLQSVTIFFQEGPGVFDATPTPVQGAVGQPSSVAVADVDGDGNQDLVTAQRSSDEVRIFLQAEPGTFAPPIHLGCPGNTIDGPVSVATGDLDGDGDLDVVVGTVQSNDLALFLQAPGGFVDGQCPDLRLGDEATTNRPVSVAVADLDRDGNLDLVSANLGPPLDAGVGEVSEEGSNLTVFFQTVAGVFDPPAILGGVTLTQDPSFVLPADLDGDGDLDLAATVQVLDQVGNSSNLAFYFQVAPGVFDPSPLLLGDTDTTGSPAALAAGDLDGDGGLDLVSFNSGIAVPNPPPDFGNDLTLFHRAVPGRPSGPAITLGNFSRSGDVKSGDLDGDGHLDLLVSATGFLRDLLVFSQRSPGVFEDGHVLGEASEVRSLEIGDLNGDGAVDVAAASNNIVEGGVEARVELFFQTEDGSFDPAETELVPPREPGASVASKSLRAVDLDGDGDRDLVVASWTGPQLSLFLQTNAGQFDSRSRSLRDSAWNVSQQPGDPNSLVAFGPSSVVAADLDGDGDMDLATEDATFGFFLNVEVNHPGGNLTFFEQTGSGEFAPARRIAESATRRGGEIETADLDGDGDLDLFTVNSFAHDLTVFVQVQPGRFVPGPVLGGYGVTTRPLAVEAADLDLDGDAELVSANWGSVMGGVEGSLTVFQQAGPGVFAPEPLELRFPSMLRPLALEVTDLDGDGEQDLIVGDEDTGELTVIYGGRD